MFIKTVLDAQKKARQNEGNKINKDDKQGKQDWVE